MLNDVVSKIINEYPFLKNSNLKVLKQFVLSDGRVSSTYLVTSNKKGFEKFVAKTFNEYSKEKEEKDELIKEYKILKLLEKKNILAPVALSPKEPINFLLMSFMKGESGAVVAKDKNEASTLFEKIGTEAGKINSVEMDNFGNLVTGEKINWENLVIGEYKGVREAVKKLLDQATFEKAQEQLKGYEYLIKDEAKGAPVLVTHDFYLDNFLYDRKTKRAVYIDYGIAMIGRPLYDLAKFYIWTLNEYPEQKDNFMKGYIRSVNLPEDYADRIKMYIIRECFGMIRFFNTMNDKKEMENTIKFLQDFLSGKSHIQKLL